MASKLVQRNCVRPNLAAFLIGCSEALVARWMIYQPYFLDGPSPVERQIELVQKRLFTSLADEPVLETAVNGQAEAIRRIRK
ncbi:MAG: hypothetical protein ACRELF_22700 [Gemmataceae bacterium]